jgi:hypothetical protein
MARTTERTKAWRGWSGRPDTAKPPRNRGFAHMRMRGLEPPQSYLHTDLNSAKHPHAARPTPFTASQLTLGMRDSLKLMPRLMPMPGSGPVRTCRLALRAVSAGRLAQGRRRRQSQSDWVSRCSRPAATSALRRSSSAAALSADWLRSGEARCPAPARGSAGRPTRGT